MRRGILVCSLFLALLATGCLNQSCPCAPDSVRVAYNDSLIANFRGPTSFPELDSTPIRDTDKDVFRLYILPSFYPDTMEVHVLRKTLDGCDLIRRFVRMGEFWDKIPPEFLREERKSLSQNAWDSFEGLAFKYCFWDLISKGEPSMDGTLWLLEANRSHANPCTKRNYHVVGRKVGREDPTEFFQICNALLGL